MKLIFNDLYFFGYIGHGNDIIMHGGIGWIHKSWMACKWLFLVFFPYICVNSLSYIPNDDLNLCSIFYIRKVAFKAVSVT